MIAMEEWSTPPVPWVTDATRDGTGRGFVDAEGGGQRRRVSQVQGYGLYLDVKLARN